MQSNKSTEIRLQIEKYRHCAKQTYRAALLMKESPGEDIFLAKTMIRTSIELLVTAERYRWTTKGRPSQTLRRRVRSLAGRGVLDRVACELLNEIGENSQRVEWRFLEYAYRGLMEITEPGFGSRIRPEDPAQPQTQRRFQETETPNDEILKTTQPQFNSGVNDVKE